MSSSRSRSASMMTGHRRQLRHGVEEEVLEADLLVVRAEEGRRRLALLVEEPLHRREELLPRERLGDVVVRPDLHAGDEVADLALDRQHRDRDVAGLGRALQRRADFPARELGHHDVEQDQVGMVLDGLLDALAPVAGEDGAVAGVVEDRLDDEKDVFVVVDDQDSLCQPSVGKGPEIIASGPRGAGGRRAVARPPRATSSMNTDTPIDPRAQLLRELGGRLRRAARREHVVDDEHALPRARTRRRGPRGCPCRTRGRRRRARPSAAACPGLRAGTMPTWSSRASAAAEEEAARLDPEDLGRRRRRGTAPPSPAPRRRRPPATRAAA